MFFQKVQGIAWVALISILLAGDSVAGDAGIGQCSDCSCTCACERVCRLEKDEKKVSVTCWGSQCEHFCLPGPSRQCCRHCEEVCTECESALATAPKALRWYHWLPGCPEGIATKKKLMKKTVTKTIPSFKWVVVDLCPRCMQQHVPPEVPEGVALPPPPQASGKVLGAAPSSIGEQR